MTESCRRRGYSRPLISRNPEPRREDLLLDQEEQEAVYNMRKALNGMKPDEAVEQILNMFARTRNNAEFVQMAKKQKFI